MLGYVICEKPEMKMKDLEVYQGYYCGICKAVGRQCGQFSRAALSYDAAFLAAVIDGVSGERSMPVPEHCAVHHIAKKPVIYSLSVEYAADVMMILARYSALDDAKDEPSPKTVAAASMLAVPFRRARSRRPELTEEIKTLLGELALLEKEASPSIDATSDCFGRILVSVIMHGIRDIGESRKRVLRRFALHLGKWIYLADAADDLEQDIEKGNYNPFVLRYGYDPAKETPRMFRQRIRDDMERNLLILCREMSGALDLLDIGTNVGIIDNIVKMGLLRSTDNVLRGREGKKDGNRSI
ncbi:MAG: DUF5685 family protein [Anaerovoracaceae bacterium]|jgi:hypothetical protein